MYRQVTFLEARQSRAILPGIEDPEGYMMPTKRANQAGRETQRFGERLAALRKAAGFTQVELAAEIGTTQRMLAYYEGQSDYPPVHLLPALAQALSVSTDELLGVTRLTRAKAPSGRLHRRLAQLEQMPPKEKRQVLQVLDTFLERERLKKQVAGG
jgi:transcriptional regulator with XRE-family HTH domain